MKIFTSLKSGFYRAIRSWKGVLVVWFALFLLVLVFICPFRGSLNSAFGNSMITEKLKDGFDIEVFADLGSTLKSLMSFFTAGFFVVYLIGFVMNAFLSAGLFGSVRNENRKYSSQEFFRSASKNFWSFLIISLIIDVIIYFLSVLFFGLPIALADTSETLSEGTILKIVIIAIVLYLLLLPVFLLTADYARAWKSANENGSGFKATGVGFGRTFKYFFQSYIMMVLLILAQVALGLVILLILPGWEPVTGGGVFLLLIISQLLLFARLLLKTWRYASITSMMEEFTKSAPGNINVIQDEQGGSN
jgi:hypothetical protein